MTTRVVAYSSLRDGHETRLSSLRTSMRNVRGRVHQPVTTSLLTFSSMATFIARCLFSLAWAGSGTGDPGLGYATWRSQSPIPNPQSRLPVLQVWQAKRDSNPQP